jgi:hypothetical protein
MTGPRPKTELSYVGNGIYRVRHGTEYQVGQGGAYVGTYATLQEAEAARAAAPPSGPDHNGKDKTTGQFVKGRTVPAHHHRTSGVKNKITKDIKEGIIDAAVAHGFDGKGKDGLVGYLRMLAARYPKAFSSLLGRLMPLQIHGTGNLPSFTGSVNIVTAPEGGFVPAPEVLMPPAVILGETTEAPPDNVVKMYPEE